MGSQLTPVHPILINKVKIRIFGFSIEFSSEQYFDYFTICQYQRPRGLIGCQFNKGSCGTSFTSVQSDKIIGSSILKAFTDDKWNVIPKWLDFSERAGNVRRKTDKMFFFCFSPGMFSKKIYILLGRGSTRLFHNCILWTWRTCWFPELFTLPPLCLTLYDI